jgi:hypothetical protein
MAERNRRRRVVGMAIDGDRTDSEFWEERLPATCHGGTALEHLRERGG